MRIVLLLIAAACCSTLHAQPQPKAVQNAFMISRMVEKFHVQPRPLDDERSDAIFNELLSALDEQRIFFTLEDYNKLAAYRLQLDDQIKNRQGAFLQLLIDIYKKRLLQADTLIDNICKTPFNFTLKEKFTVAEDTTWPAGIPAVRTKIYKLLKLHVLNNLMNYTDAAKPSKKLVDSLEPALRKKANAITKRNVKRRLQSPQGIEYIIGAMYCQALAGSYDPHTAFFPADIKEQFESQLGKKPLEYGLSFDEDEEGHVQIDDLKPGSSAFKSGRLNKGDKIQSIQWEKKEPVDVSEASLAEIERTLSASGGDKVTLTVKKADGAVRQVALQKERLEPGDEEDDDKVKSFILQGPKKIGYISLPAFYADWEDTRGINGCANDVAKEILKLKKENIEGLMIDLRYNGGGSMQEAIELAGIFIDAGPVVQVKTRDAKALTLKDGTRGTIYDGPLLLLVNGFSASASEMVAGTLQDYNRALIVGSATYGKTTAQVILPMDTAINLDTWDGKDNATSYIKLTISKLYRLNGNTAQASGVHPHIVLPDMADAIPQREANQKYFIPASAIEPNKYYKPLAPLPVSAAEAVAKKEIAGSGYFKSVQQYIDQVKETKSRKDISLYLEDAMQEKKKQEGAVTVEDAPVDTDKALYTVSNHAYEKQRLQTSEVLKEMNEEWISNLVTDPYIKIAYQLIAAISK